MDGVVWEASTAPNKVFCLRLFPPRGESGQNKRSSVETTTQHNTIAEDKVMFSSFTDFLPDSQTLTPLM